MNDINDVYVGSGYKDDGRLGFAGEYGWSYQRGVVGWNNAFLRNTSYFDTHFDSDFFTAGTDNSQRRKKFGMAVTLNNLR